ncbi:phage portal protein, partial [Escherichia coli]|nr:phage portal protein [Escherichia coli]
GTSLLENSFGPYQNLVNALKSLKASRNNASKIDRLIGVNTSSLDPVNAAALINTITAAFKKNADMMKKQAIRGGYTPTVVNNVVPVMGEGGKGSMTVDTQTTTADIGQIEDIMFYLRQLAASVGLDVTLLGWADMMSGGLGEGGFFRTSVQAAMRAQWIRNAVSTFIYRVIDIHLAFKTGKVYLPADRPYVVQFNSLNTAIQEEEQAEQESRANYASIIATVLDAVQNSPALAGSPTFMRLLCGDMFKFGDAVTDALIKELKGEVGS